jgi:hypothetical protein
VPFLLTDNAIYIDPYNGHFLASTTFCSTTNTVLDILLALPVWSRTYFRYKKEMFYVVIYGADLGQTTLR